MITDVLFGFLEAAVLWVSGAFPNDETGVWGYVDSIAGNLGAMNYFLPIAETFTLVVAVMALFPIFLGVTLSLWVAAQLRGSSSVG